MARTEAERKRLNRYVSLAFPESIDVFDSEDSETEDKSKQSTEPNKNINNTSEIAQRRNNEELGGRLAQGLNISQAAPVTQMSSSPSSYLSNNTPRSSLPNFITESEPQTMRQDLRGNIARPGVTFDSTADMPQLSFANNDAPALPPFSFSLPDSVMRQAPMLFGRDIDMSKVAKSVLATPDAEMTQARTVAAMSPEEKLLATLANTNPTPSSFWKRILAGVAQGAGQVTPNDTAGSAFGKILGSAVTRAIPAVDSANKYETNKARAIERYKLESAAEGAKLSRRKTEQDIRDNQARIKRDEDARARELRNDIDNKRGREADDARADRNQKLEILKALPEGDEQRDALAKELNVSRNLGLKETKGKETSEDQLRKRAETDVLNELGASTKERARGATANQLDAELRKLMPPDLYKALTDPNASSFKRTDAIKLKQEIEEQLFKVNLDYTDSDFQRRVSERIEQLRGSKRVTKSNNTKPQASNKVQASEKARGTDARTIKFR